MKKKKTNTESATASAGNQPIAKKTSKKRSPNKNLGNKPANKAIATPSVPKKAAKASSVKPIEQLFPRVAMCQICKAKKATRFAREPNANGVAIYRFTCGICAQKWPGTPIEISEFFSSPRRTVASWAHMDENGTDWISFGKMMIDFCEATGCYGTQPA